MQTSSNIERRPQTADVAALMAIAISSHKRLGANAAAPVD
jgi:hypothetical protein